MKQLLWICLFTVQISFSQDLSKPDKKIISNIEKHIGFLADDKLEGRRTGSAGEKLAYEYITKEFSQAGLTAKGDAATYIQVFEVNDGKALDESSHFTVNGEALQFGKDYFPLFVCNDFIWSSSGSVTLYESNGIKIVDLKNLMAENKNNPHFDLLTSIKTMAEDLAKKTSQTGKLFLYNSSETSDDLRFDGKSRALADIPVVYITKSCAEKHFRDPDGQYNIDLVMKFTEKKRQGHNVVGYINNHAPSTIILGAHYDHLGYGEDHNSLYAGTTPQIHNGADDNASGTAALIELAKLLQKSDLKQHNYVFVSFSGEELGLYGSKYFADHPTVDLSTTTCMINMDMVGRLSDSTHGLTIGGYGTSPVWGELLSTNNAYFKIKFDSSGSGPSDHTSFYRKDIPVLFFFTGIHSDYHKPSDDANKINYKGELQVIRYIYTVIEGLNSKDKIPFTKTRESVSTSKSNFKVTMGIMPDYTFSGTGVRADGISDGKPAQKAGLKAGDIIIQIGEYKCTEMQSYMEALSKFKKGDATKVKIKRGADEMDFDLVF